jgi:hypothetical protein
MKSPLLSCLLAGASLLAAASLPAQQAAPEMSSQKLEFNVSSLNGLPVHGDARGVDGLDYTAAVSVTTHGGRSVLHRLFLDRNEHVYFGYDLEAYQVEGQPEVHLHFTPLSDLSSFSGVDVSDLTPRTLALPADETVSVNAPIDVPLEIDTGGNRVLRDKLTFGPRQYQ